MIYIIHAATDGAIAAVLKIELERLCPGQRVFVASRPGDIPTGADWLREIQTNLRQSEVFLPILTPRSIGRPWIWYESGVAWLSDKRTLPVLAGGLDPSNVPYPLGAAQALHVERTDHVVQLFRDLGAIVDGADDFVKRVKQAEESASQAADTEGRWTGITLDGDFFAWGGPLASLDDKMACLLRRGCSTNSLMRGTFPHGATETGLKTTSRVAACKCF